MRSVSMKLHLNKNDFKDLLQLSSSHFGLPESFIEKDYWIMRVLKNLSTSEFKDLVIFKGTACIKKDLQNLRMTPIHLNQVSCIN